MTNFYRRLAKEIEQEMKWIHPSIERANEFLGQLERLSGIVDWYRTEYPKQGHNNFKGKRPCPKSIRMDLDSLWEMYKWNAPTDEVLCLLQRVLEYNTAMEKFEQEKIEAVCPCLGCLDYKTKLEEMMK